MARSTQTPSTSPKSPINYQASPPSSNPEVSLLGPEADVEQYGPSEEIVIGEVEAQPAPEAGPAPLVSIDDDGTITIS